MESMNNKDQPGFVYRTHLTGCFGKSCQVVRLFDLKTLRNRIWHCHVAIFFFFLLLFSKFPSINIHCFDIVLASLKTLMHRSRFPTTPFCLPAT